MKNEKETATTELLSEIYRNVTMSSDSLGAVVPKIKDKFMLRDVTAQLEKYAEYTEKAENLLTQNAAKPKEESAVKKIISRSGIVISSTVDSSPTHLAEIISRGTKNSALNLENKMCELQKQGAEEDAVNLCRSVVDFERTESNKIKDYM